MRGHKLISQLPQSTRPNSLGKKSGNKEPPASRTIICVTLSITYNPREDKQQGRILITSRYRAPRRLPIINSKIPCSIRTRSSTTRPTTTSIRDPILARTHKRGTRPRSSRTNSNTNHATNRSTTRIRAPSPRKSSRPQ
jgi:hypothetical protein